MTKKTFSITCLIFVVIMLSVFSASFTVAAEETFQKGDKILIVSPKNEQPVKLLNTLEEEIFELPNGFYVEYLEPFTKSFYKVKYHGCEGIVPVSALNGNAKKTDSSSPDYFDYNFYANKKQEAIFAVKANETASMKASASPSAADVKSNLTSASSITFIGAKIGDLYQTSTLWYYVLCDGVYGYIPALQTNNVNLDIAEFIKDKPVINPIDPDDGNTTNPTDPETPPTNNLLRILLIIGITIPAIIIVILLFKPVKNKKGRYEIKSKPKQRNLRDFDDDDFE